MQKKVVLFVLTVVFITVIPAVAIMGGGSLKHYMDETMGNCGNTGWYSGSGQQSAGRPLNHNMTRRMDWETAETMVRQYMQDRHSGTWRLCPRANGGTYYMMDIVGPNGEQIDRIPIHKQTGNMHSVHSVK